MKKSLREGLKHVAQDLESWARAGAKMAAPHLTEGPEPYPWREQRQERRLVQRLHPPSMTLRVDARVQETADTVTLRLVRSDASGELPPFAPGQYLALKVTIDGVETNRPYSIASAPGEPHVDITVKLKPDGFVSPHLVSGVAVGDELKSSGPRGYFRREPLIDPPELVFMAGGSGITPFMSMLRQQARDGFDCRVTLLYGSRAAEDVIFGDELHALAAAHDQLKLVEAYSDGPDGGLLDRQLIQREVGEVEGKLFLICGPEAMTPFCLGELDALGVPAHRRRVETFGPPDDITKQPGWPTGLAADTEFSVAVQGRGDLSAPAGEPLLNALERAGYVVPAACRTGACSACRSRLLEGEVYCPPDVGVREWDRDNGFIHPCMAYAISDLKLKLP